jgi:diguanylate cyclase (GGDEF)-like protein
VHQPPGPVVVVLDTVDGQRSRLVEGIRGEFASRGVPVLFFMGTEPSGVAATCAGLIHHGQARGLLLAGIDSPVLQAELVATARREQRIPVVTVGGVPDEASVRADTALGMRLVAHHLVHDRGARRILALTGQCGPVDLAEREAELVGALAELGVELPAEMVWSGVSCRQGALRAVREAMSEGRSFDAIVTLSDGLAAGVLHAVAGAGLRVPQDVAVVGVDDDVTATLCTPSLTTVDEGPDRQGAAAASLLIDIIAGGPPRTVRVPAELVPRGSTGAGDSGPPAAERLRTRLEALDGVLGMGADSTGGYTVEGIVTRLRRRLPRLAIERAFLVMNLDEPQAARRRLALAYYDGDFADVSVLRPFEVTRLLPATLARHLTAASLVLCPLGESGEYGYLLADESAGNALIVDALRADLRRGFDVVSAVARLRREADELKVTIEERTRLLASEGAARRRAEDELRRLHDELRASVSVDGLTGIANLRALDEALSVHWKGHSRSERPLSLLLADVDHFKAYNDRYGHVQGDEALRTVAGCLRASVKRVGDLAARCDGEKFALVMPNTNEEGALSVARRLRELLAEAAVPHEESPVDRFLTVSIGLATAVPGDLETPQDLVTNAEAALTEVKRAGRNGIRLNRHEP